MSLWLEWFRCVRMLRPACSRYVTFLWMALVMASMVIRPDLLGVTSFVRGSFLQPFTYNLLLHFFHSTALACDLLAELWIKLALRLFKPVTVDGFVVFAADGLKVPKEGKKMPAVKCLHQESSDNSKAEYIMGHSFQAISLLVNSHNGQVFSVPLLSRICEGLIFRRSKTRLSLLDKLAQLFINVATIAKVKAILVADAYYCSRKVIDPLLREGHLLVSRARSNSVAFLPPTPSNKPKRGRPSLYGTKVHLRDYFKAWQTFKEAISPVYGETDVTIKYREVDLMWRPVGRLVRFVLVKHPTRGKIILLSSSLNLDAISIIRIYGLRFKIEVSFKQAIHTLGTYAYHFWMKSMIPIKRGSGDQTLVSKSETYKRDVARKLDAYHRYVQLGCIAQGLLQHLAINFRASVWHCFRSWLRTMRTDLVPSEMVVANALKSCFPEFLLDRSSELDLKKFILDRADGSKIPGINMAS